MNAALVIFLHGVGSQGSDLAGLGQLWHAHMPETVFAAPDAPFTFDGGGMGRQWFSIAGVTPADRPARVEAARSAFDEVITPIIEAHGLTGRLDRVAFVGFSQGTIMALDAVASGRWLVGALLGYSGRLSSPEPLAPSLHTRIALIHGQADPVIPFAETQSAAARLTAAGLSAKVAVLPGVVHTISREGADMGVRFLAETLSPQG